MNHASIAAVSETLRRCLFIRRSDFPCWFQPIRRLADKPEQSLLRFNSQSIGDDSSIQLDYCQPIPTEGKQIRQWDNGHT
ncbi:hypothetical protein T265_11923 [Opisthorchis viverrini]|uniref:Uncharacterized protein n=1 Tax=Opisthorchis viverrini TaxID=6198 RepID=A0A074YX74_OPIVI|nr:hypothetical protein T265_11923 [Opisthorchis viverrini]KER19243.1 hypothetical protein T265_11923 [Opisthorchis viverrini]